MPSAPLLFVSQTQDPEEIRVLFKNVVNWRKIAIKQNEKAKATESLSPEKKRLALDTKNVAQALFEAMQEDPKPYTFYFAYDQKKRVQGIALAKITKGINRLYVISSHPKNVAIFSDDKRLKGVGKKLMTEVIRDVFNKTKNNRSLSLKSVPSACSFYKRIGFTRHKKQPKNSILTAFIMNRAKMNQFLNNQESQAQEEKEIIFTHLPPRSHVPSPQKSLALGKASASA